MQRCFGREEGKLLLETLCSLCYFWPRAIFVQLGSYSCLFIILVRIYWQPALRDPNRAHALKHWQLVCENSCKKVSVKQCLKLGLLGNTPQGGVSWGVSALVGLCGEVGEENRAVKGVELLCPPRSSGAGMDFRIISCWSKEVLCILFLLTHPGFELA